MNRKSIGAIVGTPAAALLMSYVPQFEGMVLRGYKDPIGIVTACAGHTKTAVLGRPYSREECMKLLGEDLVEHAEGVLKCTHVELDYYELAAWISFAYNVGVANYCNSTANKLINEGKKTEACAQLPRWVKAGGQVLPGLVTRRKTEMAMCLGEIS